METVVRNIGNSKGIILPKTFIQKYNFDKVIIEDIGTGIKISPVKEKSLFQQKLTELKKNKEAVYSQMKREAEDSENQKYYDQQVEDIGDVDLDIVEY